MIFWCCNVRFGDVLKKLGGENNDFEVQQESWKACFWGLEWMFQPTKKVPNVGVFLCGECEICGGGRWVKNAWVFDMIDVDIHMLPLNWFMIKLGKICSHKKVMFQTNGGETSP